MSEPIEGEVVTSGGLPAVQQASPLAISLARAEIDQQITTAHAYPRSIDRAVKNITTLATLDDQAALECIYALPRGGKPIKGASVRLAEIVAGQWGNNRVGARVVHVDRNEGYVEAEGVYHDLETNSATTARVRRRILDSKGKVYTEDMIIVTGNAAASIAKRNAILGGVPRAVWRRAYEAAEKVIAGDVKTLVERREIVLKAFAAFGVSPDRIFAALDVQGLDDISIGHLPTLQGMHAALKSGEVEVEEMFPPPEPKRQAPAPAAVAQEGAAKVERRRAPKPQAAGGDKPAPSADQAEGDAAPRQEASDPASEAQQDNGEPTGMTDDDPVLDAAREVAMEGAKRFKLWVGKQTPEVLAHLERHMAALNDAATKAGA